MSTIFSIIVPSFNCGSKIDVTLDSILSQVDGVYECIVVDGGSTDDTLTRIEARGDRVRSISEADRGIYDAMNKGIDMAQGDWIYFIGCGDKLVPNALEDIYPKLQNRKGPALVYGKVQRMDGGETIGQRATTTTLCYGENIPHQATFYSRTVFEIVGQYSLKYPILADFDLNLRCFADPQIEKVFADRIIAEYEGGGASDVRRDEAFFCDYPSIMRREFGAPWALIYAIRRLAARTIRLFRRSPK